MALLIGTIEQIKKMSVQQTRLQRLKVVQSFLSFIAVNMIYGVKKTCATAMKEQHAFEKYEALIIGFYERKGRWSTFNDVPQGEFTVVELRSHLKASLTAHNLWEKGMDARRKMADWISTYGKVLKFSTLKPLAESDPVADPTDFDVELDVPSGGSEEGELAKLLLKVTYSKLSVFVSISYNSSIDISGLLNRKESTISIY